MNGHKCTYRKQWNEDKINAAVEEVICKLVNNPKFKEVIQKHIDSSIDTQELDREYTGLQGRLKQVTGVKNKLVDQMDNLSVSDRHYDKEYEDKEAREEHRSAVEWLNNNTNKNINFFLIEIHAYKIGDSLYAPKFEVVEKPNDFIKNAKIQIGSGELNKSQSERLVFWTRFNEVLVERGKPFNVRKATTDHWYDVAIGISAARVAITLVNKEGCVEIELYINNDKDLFDSLYGCKSQIEAELGLQLDWQRLDEKKASRIRYHLSSLNFDDHSNYDALINDIIDKVILFVMVFKKYVK